MSRLTDTISTLTKDAQKLAESIMHHSVEMFDQEKHVSPAAFCIQPFSGKLEVVDIPVLDDNTRPAIWAALDEMRAHYPVVGFVSEVWMVEYKQPKEVKKRTGMTEDDLESFCQTQPRPSDHPDRIEKLMFNMWMGQRTVMFCAPITRDPPKVGDWEVFFDSNFPKGDNLSMAGGMMGKKRYAATGN